MGRFSLALYCETDGRFSIATCTIRMPVSYPFHPTWRGLIALAFLLLAPVTSQAVVKCQELLSQQSCANNAPATVTVAPGVTVSVPAPIISGFSTACWTWNRRFQCVEQNPQLYCDSGDDYATVKATCSLTAAAIDASTVIDTLMYVTESTYTYQCALGDYTTAQVLPADKECVGLHTTETPTTVPSAPIGADPSTGTGSPATTAALSSTAVVAVTKVDDYACYSTPVQACTNTCYQNVVDPVTKIATKQAVECTSPVTNCVAASSQCAGSLAPGPLPAGAITLANGNVLLLAGTLATGATVVPDGTALLPNQTLSTPAATLSADGSITQTDGTVLPVGSTLLPAGDLLIVSPALLPTTSSALGPDGRCIDSSTSAICQNGSVPKCLALGNCNLTGATPSGIQENGVATDETQTYTCSNQTTTCAKYTTVSNCVTANAWGWDKVGGPNSSGTGLAEANSAMAQLGAVQAGMNNHDIFVFSGMDKRCHVAIGNNLNSMILIVAVVAISLISGPIGTGMVAQGLAAAGLSAGTAMLVEATLTYAILAQTIIQDSVASKAFGNNCCSSYVIQGSDAPFKLGTCSIDEVELAVARQKGIVHYIGEYCSKKSGFPVRQCVEKSSTYCAFDDMLALIVNEQGRAQLDALAQADTATTSSTGDLALSLYDTTVPAAPAGVSTYVGMNTGHWAVSTQAHNSQIWTWVYPAYCKSAATQQAAYALYTADLDALANTQGIQPGQMTKPQAATLLAGTLLMPGFQECPATAGMLSFMTCSLTADNCDVTKLHVNKLPEGPTGVETDIVGTLVSNADINWQVQQVQSMHLPTDYGVTATMSTNPAYAAVSDSISSFITAVGSCHADGSCLYRYAITDKQATGGVGFKKRATDKIEFPLYTIAHTASWPTIDYLSTAGVLTPGAWAADPNKGLGSPVVVSTQRFLAHPNDITQMAAGAMHSAVLLDWAYIPTPDNGNPIDDYVALLVPTSLPTATAGWYPHGDISKNSDHFYLSGGCDVNSHWCSYDVGIDLTIPRHPWGSPSSPECWGFTLDQMAALNFDTMNLSQWVDSLNLGAMDTGMSAAASAAMTSQVTTSAQTLYSTFKSGGSMANPNADAVALVVNTTTVPMLSHATRASSYTVDAAVPANWPNWFPTLAQNNNAVTNVKVDWGDGQPVQSMNRTTNLQAYELTHDYGNDPVGTYLLKVTLDTAANGSQILTTRISIMPDAGGAPEASALDFSSQGISGGVQGTVTPSAMGNGSSQSPANLLNLSPATADLFTRQGDTVGTPAVVAPRN